VRSHTRSTHHLTGHIGSVLAETLLARGEPVTVVTRIAEKSATWEKQGAKVAVADVRDVAALHRVFARGRRAFLLNPPAPFDSNTVEEEQKTARAILAALQGTALEKVVAASTYGAQPGEGIGDLGVLYELEQGLERQPIPATIVRGAYYMSNWDMSLEEARSEGRVSTLFPADFKLPMVAPEDIGRFAAELLTEPGDRRALHFIEGPERYSARDVANAFAAALQKQVEVMSTPESSWISSLESVGFSKPAAESMAAMSRITLEQRFELPVEPTRGKTTLSAYIRALVAR
jgi:uncharacterized protein YbjT (DUF2867 family)